MATAVPRFMLPAPRQNVRQYDSRTTELKPKQWLAVQYFPQEYPLHPELGAEVAQELRDIAHRLEQDRPVGMVRQRELPPSATPAGVELWKNCVIEYLRRTHSPVRVVFRFPSTFDTTSRSTSKSERGPYASSRQSVFRCALRKPP